MKFGNLVLNVSVICGLLVASVQSANLFDININDKLTGEFLTGFESGLFLRNNSKQSFDEYNCPEQHIDSKEFIAFKSAIGPIKMLASSLGAGKPDPTITEIMDTIELFVGSFDKFIGVFDETYTGGDFCAGLTFGMQGSSMLERVATTLYE